MNIVTISLSKESTITPKIIGTGHTAFLTLKIGEGVRLQPHGYAAENAVFARALAEQLLAVATELELHVRRAEEAEVASLRGDVADLHQAQQSQ
jgi:hypothetical protein